MEVTMRRIVLLAILALPACQMLDSSAGTRTASPPSAKAPAPASAPAPAAAAKSGQPQIVLGKVSGAAGQKVKVNATLQSGGQKLAGTQNDIGFDPAQISIPAKSNGKPDCAANGALGKEGTAFSFLPAGCKTGACTSVRALVLSLSSVDPIPDGAMLYTCTVQISSAAKGAQALSPSRVGFSSPSGQAVNGGGVNGSVTVQ
jgi:hypothetical protein